MIDIETTGFSIYSDFMIHLALLEVVNSKPVGCTAVYVDWVTRGVFTEASLRQRLAYIKEQAAKRGKVIDFDFLRYQREKIDCMLVLKMLYELIGKAIESGYSLVGHNFVKFDANMLSSHYSKFYRANSPFNHIPLVDTGGLEKARQKRLIPEPGEAISQFSLRATNAGGKGIKWDLHDHCVRTYNLQQKTASLTEHDPADDCMKSHLVLETLADAIGWQP